MVVERTLSIIKPDAVEKNVVGSIYRRFEEAGLRILAARSTVLTRAEAAGFYVEHEGKGFFDPLLDYMTSGRVFVQVLEGDNAIEVNREIMGATDPLQASPGTIRAEYGTDISSNAVHGSDSPSSAQREIAYFFAQSELLSN